MIKFSPYCQRERSVYIFAILTSFLLSFWVSYQESVINPDAICYLLSAEALAHSSIRDIMQLCGQAKWPFYSILIYGFVKLTHLTYPVAAYVLDAFFSAISVFFFIRIVKALGGSLTVLWLAAFVILLSHQFNSVREYIIRDHGFWAFYLSSLYFFLRFFQKPHWLTALCWSASLLVATLFRIEGAIFLLSLPFLIWCAPRFTFKQKAQSFLLLNIPIIIIGLGILVWVAFHPQGALDKLGRVAEVITQLQQGFHIMVARYDATKIAMAEHVLLSESSQDVGLVLFLVLIVWYLISVMANLSWIYSLLVIYAWIKKAKPLTWAMALVLSGYILVNVAITYGFLLERLFLSKRYLIALSLVFMLWVPFALHDLLQRCSDVRYRIALLLITFCILITSLGGVLDFGYSKRYIRDAGDWLAENVPAQASLFANDFQLMYYSRHFGNSIFEKQPSYVRMEGIANNEWKQYDYLALRIGKTNEGKLAALLSSIHLTPLREFSNERGDKVLIYKVK